MNTQLVKCPACGHNPFIVEREEGSINWFSTCCGVEMEPDAKALIGTIKVKPSKEGKANQVQSLIDSLQGQISDDLTQALKFKSAAAYRERKAIEYLDERGMDLVREAKKICGRILGVSYDVRFHHSGYMIEHHVNPPIVKAYLSLTVYFHGWEIKKTFWPRRATHIEEMARKIKATFSILEGISDAKG